MTGREETDSDGKGRDRQWGEGKRQTVGGREETDSDGKGRDRQWGECRDTHKSSGRSPFFNHVRLNKVLPVIVKSVIIIQLFYTDRLMTTLNVSSADDHPHSVSSDDDHPQCQLC